MTAPCVPRWIINNLGLNRIQVNVEQQLIEVALIAYELGTGGGIRTRMPIGQGILSPPRLPFRHPGTDDGGLLVVRF